MPTTRRQWSALTGKQPWHILAVRTRCPKIGFRHRMTSAFALRTPPDHAGPLCPDYREELLEQPKEILVDMLGGVAGVNVIAMASLSLHSPDSLDTLGLWNAPKREGFSRRPVTMKELTRKNRRVH
jgi:hypothetical protein